MREESVSKGKKLQYSSKSLGRGKTLDSNSFLLFETHSCDFGSSDVACFGSSDVASFGSSNVASFSSSDVANFGSSNVASFGSSNVANFGSSYVACSLYTCHACTDSELCDSCIDEFLNIVVDSPVTHSHCTNTIDAGIRQQSDLFVQVQAATKPSFATFFPSVLQAPDWTPPFDLECDIAVYAFWTVLASYEFDFLPP
ncbi:hypothetical protein Lal_00049307 [Lupinus albus]|nr:hypothetical protein Lal_00049307 [Lupinus albus]